MNKFLSQYKHLPIPAKASFWFLLCSFLQKGISTVTTPIFTRLLTPAEYGQYNVFNSWFGIVTVFVSLNLYYGVFTQGLVKFEQERTIFASSLQGLSTTLVAIWTLIYFIGHNFWNNLFSLTTVQMLAMLTMIWTSSAFNFWAAEQRVLYKYRLLVVVTCLVSIAKPVIGIILVLCSNDKVTARILGLAFVELIGYSWCFIFQMRQGKMFFSYKYWKYALLFNLPLVPHYLSQNILNNSDRIMISNQIGTGAAGIYSLAYSIAMIMTLFNTALSQTLSPWIYKKIKEKQISDIAPVAYLSLAIVGSTNLVLIMIAPEVVRFFAPASYYEAIYCIPPIAMGVFFLYSYDLFAKFAFYYERTKLIMCASVVGAVLNVLLNYFFINIFGYIAAAYTTLICYIVYAVFHYMLSLKICHLYLDGVTPYSSRKLIGYSLLFLLCGFIMLFTYNYPVIRYMIIVVILFVLVKRRKEIFSYLYALKTIR